jgi:hypothetical protein
MGDEPTGALLGLRAALGARPSHALAALLFLARLADIVSTRLASPRLALEANPIVRKLGWPFAWATLLVCFVAYIPGYGPEIALPAIVVSLFVAGSNFVRGWPMRALGEDAYRAQMRRAVAAASPGYAYFAIAAGNALVAAVGLLLLACHPDPREPAFYFAVGILLYAFAGWLHATASLRRMRRELRWPVDSRSPAP